MANEKKTHTNGVLRERAYALNPTLKVVFCGEDEILILHGTRSDFRRVIRDEGRTKLLSRIVRHLDTPASIKELREAGVVADEEAEDAEALIERLVGENILVDPGERLTAIYLRTLNGAAAPLAERTVGFVGAGPLGARVAAELARLDVGRFCVLDDRRVEQIELARRQFGSLAPAVAEGKPYAACLGDYLEMVSYEGELITKTASCEDEEAVRALLQEVDFAVVASEVFTSSLFHRVDAAAVSVGRPWMSAFINGSEASIGPVYVPGESCCYNEFEIQCEAALSISQSDYHVYKEEMNKRGLNSPHFVLPPHLSTAAGFVAGAVASFLSYQRSYLVGRCLRVNFEKPRVDYEEVLRLPRTPTTASTRQGYRHTFM